MTRSGDDALGDDEGDWFTPRNGLPAQRSEPVDEETGTRHDRYSQSVTDWLETRGVRMAGLFTGELDLGEIGEKVREVDPAQALKPSDIAAAEIWDSPTFWELATSEGLPTTLKTGEGYGYLREGDGVIAGTRTLRLTAMALDVQAKASERADDDAGEVEALKNTAAHKAEALDSTAVEGEAADRTDAPDSTASEGDAPESTDA